jgi:acetyl-CoA acetyltransferase
MTSRARRLGYEGVAVLAPVTIPYERYSIESAHWWLARALNALLQQCAIEPARVDGLSVSSFTLVPDTAVGFCQHVGLSPRWLDHIPMGGASAIVALRRAARAVQAGDAEFIACVAGDTNHIDSFRRLLSSFSRFAQDAVYPYGYGGPNAVFALLTDYYMRAYGATREDFGKLCVSQRDNALRFPHALMKTPLSLAGYLAARPISDPLHLFDCVMPCAGAEAFAVTSIDMAEKVGAPYARILSTIERHNAFPDDPIQWRGGWAMDAFELYQQAERGPRDIDVVMTYDDYPVISMLQFEDLGFCAKGEGPGFVRDNSFTCDGSFPHNTSGGQLSVGQAGAAGGYLGLVEALRQITGQALGAQVRDAQRALVCGFGMVNYDRGVCSGAAILEGASHDLAT